MKETLQDSRAKDQFIDVLEGHEIRMMVSDLGPNTLDKALSCALQLENVLEADKGCQVRAV